MWVGVQRWLAVPLLTAGCFVANPAWTGGDAANGESGTSRASDTTTGSGSQVSVGSGVSDDSPATASTTGAATSVGPPVDATGPPTPTTGGVPADWWDESWVYRRVIQVQPEAQIERPTALPVRIEDSADPLRFAEQGRDVRFVTAGGQLIAHDVDAWQPISGEPALVWFRFTPDLEGETIYLYYGNPDAVPSSEAGEVWLPEYAAVWHLSSEQDATTLGANLEPGIEVGSGILGDGGVFQSGLEVPTTGFQDMLLGGSMTVSAWILPWTAGGQGEGRIVHLVTPVQDTSVALHITTFQGEPSLGVTRISAGMSELSALGSVPIELGDWLFVAVTFDGMGIMSLQVDEIGGDPEPLATGVGMLTPGAEPQVGIGGALGDPNLSFDGLIDEVRVRFDAQSPEALVAEYAAQQGEAAVLGPEEGL